MSLRRRALMGCTGGFNFDVPESTPQNYSPNRSAKLTPDTCVVGLSRNTYHVPGNCSLLNKQRNSVKVLCRSPGYGVSYPKALEAGKTYRISTDYEAVYNKNTGIGITFYASDGTRISYTDAENYSTAKNLLTKTFEVPSNAEITSFCFYCSDSNTTGVTFFDTVLEEVST